MTDSDNISTGPPDATPPPASLTHSAQISANWVWRVVRVFFRVFFRCWVRLRADGHGHIDNTRGGLFLINHQSFLDPLLVALLVNRPVSFLARDSLFRIPLLGWLLRRTYVIPISRTAVRGGSIRNALERLDAGFLVGIFPEGTRSSGNSVAPFRPGFMAIVRRTDMPIYPVGIAGADRVMPKGAWLIRPRRVQVVYGAAIAGDDLKVLHTGTDDKELSEIGHRYVTECQQRAALLLSGPQPDDASA